TWAGRFNGAVKTPSGTSGIAAKLVFGWAIAAMTALQRLTCPRSADKRAGLLLAGVRRFAVRLFLGLSGYGQGLFGELLPIEHLGRLVERARLANGHAAGAGIVVARPACCQRGRAGNGEQGPGPARPGFGCPRQASSRARRDPAQPPRCR